MTKSRAAASSLPKCKYSDKMAFFHEKSCNKPSWKQFTATVNFHFTTSFTGLSKILRKNKTNTMSQVSGLSSKKRKVDEAEVHLMKQFSDNDNDIKKLLTESESEDSLYCRSLVPMLEMLPLKKKRLAKIRISQLLDELQFDTKCN